MTQPRAGGVSRLAPLLSMSLLGVLGVVALGSLACRREAPGRTPTGAAAPSGSSPASNRKSLRIAMIGKSSTNPSFLSARRGAEDQARAMGAKLGSTIEIDWLTPSQEDGAVQAQRILQAVNDHVDAILISCSDDEKVSRAIDDAVSRGVAVMTFDSDAPASHRFAYCGVDDFRVGERVMLELATILTKSGQKSGSKPIEVAVLAGNRTAPNLRLRVEGVLREAARHPNLKIVGTFFHVETPQDAGATIQRAGVQFPDIQGWAMVGGWPLYTKTLLSDLTADAARSGFKIVALNALPPQLIYIEKGIAPVLLAQPTYLWGSLGVETIVKKVLLNQEVPALVPADLMRVTIENLGAWARQLKAWGFADVPDEYLRMK